MFKRILTTADTFFAYIDNGEIFRNGYKWVYIFFAVITGISPFGTLYTTFRYSLFNMAFGTALAFLLIWLFILIAGVLGCLLWWRRKNDLIAITSQNNEFIASVIFAHFLQTIGEILAIYLAVVGTGVCLVCGIFLGSERNYELDNVLPIHPNVGLIGVIGFPVAGFLVLIFFRFIAEQIKALATIATNTKKWTGTTPVTDSNADVAAII
jgi:hypothetical protein